MFGCMLIWCVSALIGMGKAKTPTDGPPPRDTELGLEDPDGTSGITTRQTLLDVRGSPRPNEVILPDAETSRRWGIPAEQVAREEAARIHLQREREATHRTLVQVLLTQAETERAEKKLAGWTRLVFAIAALLVVGAVSFLLIRRGNAETLQAVLDRLTSIIGNLLKKSD
jgi:hypothetical protein